LCVLIAGSLLCGNARHLAVLVYGRRGRRHWLSVSSFVMLSAFRSRVLTLSFSRPYGLSDGWSRCCCLCLCGAFALMIPWDYSRRVSTDLSVCCGRPYVWLLDVVVFYLGTRLTLGYSCVGLRVGNSVGVSYGNGRIV